jgi:class 3 adenylate cyclase
MSPSQRSLCVLFADVSGSTRLYEKLGDTEAMRAVERCLNRMSRATETYQGRVVKTIGDEVMAVFDSADQALQAACEMQQRVEKLPPVSGVTLSIRVGMQYGPIIEENSDYFGDTVNTASRMAGLAKGGQIFTTGETVNALSPLLRQATREIDALAIKGKSEDVHVFEVLWQETTELTMKASSIMRQVGTSTKLVLRHSGEEHVFDPSSGGVSLGRDGGSDVVIGDRRASRSHARIERRRDKFVLVDQSTNGTFVTFEGEPEFALKHEEIILRGRGRISFGHAYSDDPKEIVAFEIAE